MDENEHLFFYAGAIVGILSSIIGNFGVASYFRYIETGDSVWLSIAKLTFAVTAIAVMISIYGIIKYFPKQKVKK
jgi:uncharacterized membrane protein YgdD (TMEM256/DUF423 family)